MKNTRFNHGEVVPIGDDKYKITGTNIRAGIVRYSLVHIDNQTTLKIGENDLYKAVFKQMGCKEIVRRLIAI